MARIGKPDFYRYIQFTALIVWIALLTPNSSAVRRPFWIDEPKTEDSIYIYSVGYAEKMSTPEQAEREAYRNALLRILRTHRSDIEDPDRWIMRNVSIMPGCIHHEQTDGLHSCWIQVMWPKRERANLVEQMTVADHIDQQWKQAQAMAAEGQPSESRKLLLKLLPKIIEKPATEHLLPAVQYQIARTWHIENRPLEARRWYERLIQQAPDDPLALQSEERLNELPPPPRFWPMNARFSGGPIGLLALISDNGKWKPFRDLTRALAQETRSSGMEGLDAASHLSTDILQDIAEKGIDIFISNLTPAPTVTILITVDIDSDKRGTTTVSFGAKIPVVDTRVGIHVKDMRVGTILYEENFAVIAGARSSANLAEHISNILINNHLLPHCPGLDKKNIKREHLD